MMDRILAAALALAAPMLALAQGLDNRTSNAQPVGSDVGAPWLLAVVVVAAAAIAIWGFRVMRQRRGPHGWQEPTPRGP